jgi:hypothetical protein
MLFERMFSQSSAKISFLPFSLSLTRHLDVTPKPQAQDLCHLMLNSASLSLIIQQLTNE